jgi:hypothetical protein
VLLERMKKTLPICSTSIGIGKCKYPSNAPNGQQSDIILMSPAEPHARYSTHLKCVWTHTSGAIKCLEHIHAQNWEEVLRSIRREVI